MLISEIVKLVIFSPYANIWEHSFPEALIAEALSLHGAEIITVRCGGMLRSHCIAMSAAAVPATSSPETKARVCTACIKRRGVIDDTMGFESHVLDQFVSTEDTETVNRHRKDTTRDNWEKLEVDGVPLGRYAAYEFFLDNKLAGTTIPEELWEQYLNHLSDTLTTFFAARKFLAKLEPDAVIVSNRLYSVHHAFCEAAKEKAITTYTLQGGGHIVRRGETLTMMRDNQLLDSVFDSDSWKSFRTKPLTGHDIAIVSEHFDGLLNAHSAFAYSSAFEGVSPQALRSQFGIDDKQTVLLAAMSSEDEVNAAKLADALPETSHGVSLFSGQFQWLEAILAYAEKHSEHCIIVRLHPRMFPNKRENVTSPSVDKILKILEDRPSNVILNHPQDNVSLYDLLQIVDVLLNHHSSVGAECAAFGIPVVVPQNANFFTYPQDINRIATSVEDFDRLIDEAILSGWSLEQSRKAFRWFAFLFTRFAVDFSESVHSRPSILRPKKPGFSLWLWRKMVWIVLQYGPLVRERWALKRRVTPVTAGDIFFDVISHKRASLADSTAWPPTQSSLDDENKSLAEFFSSLVNTRWRNIDDPRSLSERIILNLDIRHKHQNRQCTEASETPETPETPGN